MTCSTSDIPSATRDQEPTPNDSGDESDDGNPDPGVPCRIASDDPHRDSSDHGDYPHECDHTDTINTEFVALRR